MTTASKTTLDPVASIQDYAVIIRCIHERGGNQQEALAELDRRGLWLSEAQRRQAGLSVPEAAKEQRSSSEPQTPAELQTVLMLAHAYIEFNTPPVSKSSEQRKRILAGLQKAWEAIDLDA